MTSAPPGTPPVVVGPGRIDRLAGLPEARPGVAAVLAVDPAIERSPIAVAAAATLMGAGCTVHLHVVPAHEPTAASVDALAATVRATGPTVLVAIGGGSALDTAKQAAAVAGAALGVEAYALGARALPPSGPPVVAVPTTAGTGAEVTRTCVVTTAAGRKVWLWGEELLPRLIVLDPLATVSMPAHVTTATGLDAFVHAVEAASARRTTPEVEAVAGRAIRLVLDHLPVAVADGTDVAARQGMQEAAFLAGVAIDAGGTGIAHALGHALGTVAGAQGVHLPHGVAVAVSLAAALPWNVAGAPAALGAVATAVGRPVDQLATAYCELLMATGLPAAVARIGPLDVDPDALAAELLAPENLPMHDNNCRRPDDHDRRHLAHSTLQTWADLLTASER